MPKKSKDSSKTTLKNMSDKYDVPVGILRQVMRRGQGAFFSSGSRPGQTPISWGIARARSFASGSGGARTGGPPWKGYKTGGAKAPSS